MATETMPQAVQIQAEPTLQNTPTPPQNGQAIQGLAPAKPVRDRIQVHYDPTDPASLYMDTGLFEQLQRVALLMSRSNLVPAHLRGEDKVSDCFLVVAQAFRWRMDCFAAAQHTLVVKGKLGYEGKLIAAMINASGKTEKNLDFKYTGTGPGRKVVVTATLKGEKEPRTVEGTVDQWSTENDMWRTDPDQILAYRGARQWGRRHAPEIMLGINADEELPAMARSVEMARTPSGGFAPKTDAPRPVDPLLAAIGITPDTEPKRDQSGPVTETPDSAPQTDQPPADFVLVSPAPPPLIDPKVCTHAAIPPSRLKPGKFMHCPDCGTTLTGDPVQP